MENNMKIIGEIGRGGKNSKRYKERQASRENIETDRQKERKKERE